MALPRRRGAAGFCIGEADPGKQKNHDSQPPYVTTGPSYWCRPSHGGLRGQGERADRCRHGRHVRVTDSHSPTLSLPPFSPHATHPSSLRHSRVHRSLPPCSCTSWHMQNA